MYINLFIFPFNFESKYNYCNHYVQSRIRNKNNRTFSFDHINKNKRKFDKKTNKQMETITESEIEIPHFEKENEKENHMINSNKKVRYCILNLIFFYLNI
jgi:hypothetical protein